MPNKEAPRLKALMLHSENSAVGKYRIWQPAKYLDRMGWNVERIPDQPETIAVDHKKTGDGCWECRLSQTDIIVMQRPDKPESIALALGLREQSNAPLVFEVDDNIYDVAESSTSYQYWYPGSPLFDVAEILMREADAITVSTPELVEVYKHLNPNIFVLPNFQDLEDWKGVKVVRNSGVAKSPNDTIVIGWQGSSTHYDDLHMIRRPLKKLLHNYHNTIFRCVGLKADFLVGHPQVEISTQWSPVRQWPKRLAGLGYDIGIAPVVDRPFNRAKSNIKWQEYSMLGIPTVASKVGEYKAINHGATGFLAYTELEWYHYLEKLVKDENLRRTVGSYAQRIVKSEFSMKSEAKRWDETYRAIIEKYKGINGLQKQNSKATPTR